MEHRQSLFVLSFFFFSVQFIIWKSYTEMGKERSPLHQFTPHMDTTAESEPGPGWELHSSLVRGWQLSPLPWLSQTRTRSDKVQAGIWIRGRASRT